MADFQQQHAAIENLTAENSAYLDLEVILTDAVEAVEQATPEAQACAYVCGFIFKKLRNSDCENCRKVFLTDDPEAIHLFTSFREYNASQNTLNYLNKDIVICVESIATITNNFRQENGFVNNIKKYIMILLECLDYSCLNKCGIHADENKNHIKLSTFCIVIKRFTIITNRQMEEEEKKKSLERKIQILRHK